MSYHLPMKAIKNIIKCSADAEYFNKEYIRLMTTATELFIKDLAKSTLAASNGNDIQYKHVADVVNTIEKYNFLQEIIPRKVPVKHIKKLIFKKTSSEETSEESDNSENN